MRVVKVATAAATASSRRGTSGDATIIKLLVDEGAAAAGASGAFLRFDPAYTQLYADGWIAGESAPMRHQDRQPEGLVAGRCRSCVLVAFNAVIPLMTVVNYSVQETFGDNVFFFEGVKWFEQVLRSARFHDALQRQLLFTAIILAIEVPLGVAIALAMPRKGLGCRCAWC